MLKGAPVSFEAHGQSPWVQEESWLDFVSALRVEILPRIVSSQTELD